MKPMDKQRITWTKIENKGRSIAKAHREGNRSGGGCPMPTETAKIAQIQSRRRQAQSNLHAAIAPGVATAISKQAIGNSESARERRDRRASQSRPRSKKMSPPTARRRGARRSGAARQGEGGETAGGFEGRAGAGRGSGSRAKRGRGVERNWGKARRGREG